jgi:hypothetical protein
MKFLNTSINSVQVDREANVFLLLISYLKQNRQNFPKFSNKLIQSKFIAELEFWSMREDATKLKKIMRSEEIEKLNESI